MKTANGRKKTKSNQMHLNIFPHYHSLFAIGQKEVIKYDKNGQF